MTHPAGLCRAMTNSQLMNLASHMSLGARNYDESIGLFGGMFYDYRISSNKRRPRSVAALE